MHAHIDPFVAKIFADNSRLTEQLGGGSVAKMFADNSRLTEQLGGGSVAKMFADNRRLTEQLGGGSVAKMFADNRRLIDSILGRSSFAAMVGAHESVSHVLSQGRFASTFGGAALPRSAWEGVLDSLRTPLTSGVYESTVSAFETAYDEAGDSDGSTCWLVRLPPLAQLGLLLVLLQALDSIGQSLVSLTGEDVPSDYQDGARILFALATAIYACIVTRAEHSSSKR